MGSYEWQVYRMCILFYFNLQHEEKPLKWVYSWISNENWEKDVRVLTDKVFDLMLLIAFRQMFEQIKDLSH